MKKPLIGITLDNEEPGVYSKFPWYAIRKNYLHSIENLGGIPLPLLHTQLNIKEIFSLLDAIVITGGNFDISPSIYGKKNISSRSIKNNRTNFEIKICEMGLKKDIPILGICGGEQLINVCFGGTLIQDINKLNIDTLNHEQTNPRSQTSHKVKINKFSKLYKIIKKLTIKVNSAHHQAVDKLGKNLIISGKSEDGIIESIESIEHKWCIGVQWHPEFLITNADKLLISNFIKNCKKNI